VIQEKARSLGSNREVPLLAFDGFAQQATSQPLKCIWREFE